MTKNEVNVIYSGPAEQEEIHDRMRYYMELVFIPQREMTDEQIEKVNEAIKNSIVNTLKQDIIFIKNRQAYDRHHYIEKSHAKHIYTE